MKKVTISVYGKTPDDIEVALQIIAKQLHDGFVMGSDKNEDGRYHWVSIGEFEEGERSNDDEN